MPAPGRTLGLRQYSFGEVPELDTQMLRLPARQRREHRSRDDTS